MLIIFLARSRWQTKISVWQNRFASSPPHPETFTGPFTGFIAYAHYLLPLAVYELYLLAKRHGGANGRYAMAGLMVVCTLVTIIGVFAAALGMWLPEM